MLMLLAISIPSAWAEDEVYKTALFGSSYNSKGVSSYTASWSSTNDGFTVDIVNANNNNNGWNYIKTGNKNSTSIGSIITASVIDKAVTKVDVTIDAVTTSNVNNITLYTSSDKSRWTKVSEYVVAKGTPSVSISTPTANLYYKIDFDCKKGSSNGIVTISKVEYYISSSGDTPQPTIPVEQVQLNKSEITLEVDESETLIATVAPTNATNTSISWESSNTAVATVTNGVITAVSAGDATITCKSVADPSKSATCAVHVNPSPYTKSTLIFTAACGGSGTANDDAVWTVTSDGEESNYDGTSGIHYGTNSKSVTFLQLATSDIEGTVARVVVNARDAQAKATISVSVGGDNFSCADPAATNTSSDFSFTGSGSGEIIVRVDRGSSMTKALYVKSIVVYYIAAPQKDPAGLAYDDADLSNLVKLGDAFTAPTLTNPNSLDVTYASDNTTVAEVASNGAVTIKAVGKAVITASSEETGNYKAGSASYTIYVTAHAGTVADPYTVADARLAIDCGAGVTGVYATGIVSEIVTPYNSQYGNISYNISTDGQTTSDQLQAFRGKAKDGENFTSADDVMVGDEVVVKGNLTKYNATYEFAADNQLYSLTRNKEDAGLAYAVTEIEKNIDDAAFTNALTNPHSLAVTYSSSAEAVATVDANGVVTIVGMGTTTITASFAGDASYITGEASYTLSVNDPSLTKVTFDATTDIATDNTEGVTKSGINIQTTHTDGINDQSTAITYYQTFKSQKLTVTSTVGNIKRIEFVTTDASHAATGFEGVTDNAWAGDASSVELTATGNQVRMSSITVYYKADNRAEAGLAYAETAVEKTVGDDAFINALTNPNSVAVTYESSNTNVAEIANNGSVTIKAQGSATISATFAGDETYKPATVTYTITVNPASEDTRKTAQDVDGFDAISGNLNNDISFASNQGDGTAAPNLKDGSIQYYQPGSGKASGGYMTITAVNGCKIDQVKVVTATNATSIKYSKDDGDLSEATEVETGADYLTPAALNAQTVNIYCAGADKNHRLFIAQVVVYYTGEPVAVDHLILSGEYQTEFVQGDEFNHDGLIVTAAYDAQGSETVDVTAQAVVTTPDMSTTGEKTVTVSFGGKETTYTINVAVNTDLDDLSGTWVLVTDASQLVAGKKVIIAEAVESDGEVESMGVQNNNNRAAIVSTVASGILSPNTATKTFTLVDAGSSKWALQGTDSKYLYAASSSSNYLKSQDEIDDNATWTIGIENSKAAITANGTNTRNIIRFNSTSSLFSCYASGQSDIALYIQQQEDIPVVPEPDYTRSITAGQFGTICLPNGGTIEGATIFEIAYTKEGKIFFDEISEATMVAGRPYIFYPNNGTSELKVYYTGSEDAAAGNYNGLYGSYGQSLLTPNDGNYILYDNKYYLVDSEAYVGANRAYIKLGKVPTEEQAPAPGRRRVSMDVQGEQVATSIINTHDGDQPMKVMIDNQLYIIRAGQMFDMTGNKIK